MHLIVYTSYAVHSFGQEELVKLRALSASVNRFNDITGLLVFDGKRFIQALEGEANTVIATMNRIYNDRRHTKIVMMEDRNIVSRQFGSWSTEYRETSGTSNDAAFVDRVKSKVVNVEDDSTKAAFIGFSALSIRRWARSSI